MNSKSQNILNYRVSGSGYPVVFLHGFLESMSMWNFLDLSGFKAILIDLPGHGCSPIERNETIDSMAEKVICLLKELGLNEYSIVGHSMGGYVGLEIVSKDSACEKVILLNSNFWSDNEQKKLDRKRVSEIVLDKKVQFIREAIPNLFSDATKYPLEIKELISEANQIEANSIAICSLAMRDRDDKSVWVAEHQNKVVVLQGTDDPIVSSLRMKEEALNLGIDFHEVQAGHMAHIENSDRVNELLRNELKKTETN